MSLALFPQASGEAGVRQTLRTMAVLTRRAMLDGILRSQAALAISGCPRGHVACQCHAVLAWVNRHVQYVPDPDQVEALHDPRLMAHAIADRKRVFGDCDDMSMYVAALLKSIGRQPIFRAVGYDGKPYQHVYVCCDGLPLDATRVAWGITFKPNKETLIMEEKI